MIDANMPMQCRIDRIHGNGETSLSYKGQHAISCYHTTLPQLKQRAVYITATAASVGMRPRQRYDLLVGLVAHEVGLGFGRPCACAARVPGWGADAVKVHMGQVSVSTYGTMPRAPGVLSCPCRPTPPIPSSLQLPLRCVPSRFTSLAPPSPPPPPSPAPHLVEADERHEQLDVHLGQSVAGQVAPPAQHGLSPVQAGKQVLGFPWDGGCKGCQGACKK